MHTSVLIFNNVKNNNLFENADDVDDICNRTSNGKVIVFVFCMYLNK